MGQTKAQILFIDDDHNFRKVTTFALGQAGYGVRAAANGEEGLAALNEERPDAILCDLKMPVMDGMSFLAALAERGDAPPVIVITAYGSIETAVAAMRAGAVDYITKPINRDELHMALDRALDHQRLRRENRALREQVAGGRAVDRLIGVSPAMQTLREMLLRLAESNAPVLLRGESGVGKELAARVLHYDGPRAQRGQFVVLNCAAIPPELLESELFGHRKGAFTGAVRDHVGKFEAADGGTLFLDEIGDMPFGLQAKLLRALQEGEIAPLGESRARRVDARVVSATNQPLEECVAAGRFREDLYYRLAVVPLELPPLRARPEDLLLLARQFLARHGAPGAELSAGAERALTGHTWPGNVRELENAIMRACALRPGLTRLETEDLPPLGGAGINGQGLWGEGPLRLPAEGVDFEQVEKRLLQAAWEQSGHTQKRGAELLGLPRQAFIYRLQKHGIIPPYGERPREEGEA